MKRVFVCGLGAVSPAGWDLGSLRKALQDGSPLPTASLTCPGHRLPLTIRPVPAPPVRPAFLGHPRLRRTSPVTHYAAAAAIEALGGFGPGPARTSECPQSGSLTSGRLGLVCCYQSGCVQFSARFFEEALRDPATASPLAFPETVFAAPTSHLATLLGNVELASTVIGDPASFLQGIALAADWLVDQKVDLCLVVGAEESHWLMADALWQFQHEALFASGAGAVCLSLNPALSLGVELERITDAHTYNASTNREQAAQAMRAQLPPGHLNDLLCDGLDNSPRASAAERKAWENWPGARLSPKLVLGEGLMAATAWQCVAGCDAVAQRTAPAAMVSLVGCNQQAIGARFAAHEPGPPPVEPV